MASGHVNRIYRPNTWQHRPSLRREDFTCQPGAVHTWHETDMPEYLGNVRCWVNSGKHLLSLSFSDFDPTETWGPLGLGDPLGCHLSHHRWSRSGSHYGCTRCVLKGTHATARVHRAHRRGRGMAAFRASAGGRAEGAHRGVRGG